MTARTARSSTARPAIRTGCTRSGWAAPRTSRRITRIARRAPHDLDCSAGGARTAAGKHQEEQEEQCRRRPHGEVSRRVAGRRDRRYGLEHRMPDRSRSGVAVLEDENRREDRSGRADQREVRAQFLVAQEGTPGAEQRSVPEPEVDPRRAIRTIAIHCAVGPNASNDRGSGEKPPVASAAKEWQTDEYSPIRGSRPDGARQPERRDADRRDADVQPPQAGRGVPDTRHELVEVGARRLALHQRPAAAREPRQHGQRQHDDAHAPEPLGHRAPEAGSRGRGSRCRSSRSIPSS